MNRQSIQRVSHLMVSGVLSLLLVASSYASVYVTYDENGRASFTNYGSLGDRDYRYESNSNPIASGTDSGVNLPQLYFEIEAVNFEMTSLFEQEIKQQASVAYLAISQHFFNQLDTSHSLSFNIRVVEGVGHFLNLQQTEIGHIISKTGYYSLDTEQVTILKKRSTKKTFKTLKHEACHRVLHYFTHNRVRWLNEGIAENCESVKYEGGGIVSVNQNKDNQKYVNGAALNGELIKLADLMSGGDYQAHNSQNNILSQIQSGEFIYFLLSKPESKYWLSQLLLKDSDQDMASLQVKERLIDLQEEFERWAKN